MTAVQLDIEALRGTGTEIARYRVADGERVIVGRGGHGGVEILDLPTTAGGRRYRVDGGYRDAPTLQAFIEDYVQLAGRLDRCPMGGEALEAILADTESEVVDELVAAIWNR
jgi:hypothetical protein